MKILALECSAGPASAAIIENGNVLASTFVNVKLTHSQTLMPMVENLLKNSVIKFDDIEGIAIANGPGSFTGIRIGIAAAKGLSAAKNISLVGVSTLLSMAYNFTTLDCIVCAVMDARCNQFYNALFEISGGSVTRLCDDRAILCEDLEKEIKIMFQSTNKCVIIVGDGAKIFYPYVEKYENVILASENVRFQNAVAIGLAAEDDFLNGKTVSSKDLLPVYLRLPQAERELKKKQETEKD